MGVSSFSGIFRTSGAFSGTFNVSGTSLGLTSGVTPLVSGITSGTGTLSAGAMTTGALAGITSDDDFGATIIARGFKNFPGLIETSMGKP